MHRVLGTGLIATLGVAAWAGPALADASCFEGYRLDDAGLIEVRVGDSWYQPSRIAGVPADDLLVYAVLTHGVDWLEAFTEELDELLERRLGERVGDDVEVVLTPSGGGDRLTRRLPLTERAVRLAEDDVERLADRLPAIPEWAIERVEREHASETPPHLRQFAERLANGAGDTGPRLTRAQAERDLDQLEWLLNECHSYRTLRDVDLEEVFDAIRAGLGDGISVRDFRLQLHRALALLGDPHTRIRGLDDDLLPGYLPFRVREGRRRILAVGPDGKPFSPGREAVLAIDGEDIEYWVAQGARLVADGTTFFERPWAADLVNDFRHLRAQAGRDPDGPAEVTFMTFRKKDPFTETVPLTMDRPAREPDGPVFEHRVIEGDVGYMRIRRMRFADERMIEALARRDPGATRRFASVEAVHRAMADFKRTSGLVIDVRGNTGGGRRIITELLPYLTSPEEPPAVVSVARYRLRPGDRADSPLGFLSDRFMHPRAWPGWTPAERAAINRFDEIFDPQPHERPPLERFSARHYMVVSPPEGGARRHYDKPVVVLSDWRCFSATDIFLGAMKTRPTVTIIGQPSGGGSGRNVQFELAESRARVRISSMWSFQPTGDLYDGNGVHPHIPINRALGDMLGETDTILDRAVLEIRGEPTGPTRGRGGD